MNNFAELLVQLQQHQLQQHQITTDQMNEDSYSTVNDCLSPDYALPTINPPTSPQVHSYASLANAEGETHGYTDLMRSKESTTKLTSASEQCPQVHSTVITRDDNKATAHQSHYYASLKNPEAIVHKYAVLTTSTNVTSELISIQYSRGVNLLQVCNKEVSASLPSEVHPPVQTPLNKNKMDDTSSQ